MLNAVDSPGRPCRFYADHVFELVGRLETRGVPQIKEKCARCGRITLRVDPATIKVRYYPSTK